MKASEAELLLRESGRAVGPPVGQCLSDEELAAAAAELSTLSRPEHVASCSTCLDALVGALDAVELVDERTATVTATDEWVRVSGPGFDEMRAFPDGPAARVRLALAAAEAGAPYGREGNERIDLRLGDVRLACTFECADDRISATVKLRSRVGPVRVVLVEQEGRLVGSATLRPGESSTFGLPKEQKVSLTAMPVG